MIRKIQTIPLVLIIIMLCTQITNAATTALNYSFTQSLTTGKTNSIPVLEKQIPPTNDATLFWVSSEKINNISVDSKPLKFSYEIGDGKVVVLTITKTNNKANIEYDVLKTGTPLSSANFMVFYHNVNNGIGSYIPAAEYITTQNINDQNKVENDNVPRFTIAEGGGFSFKFDNTTVSILWNAQEQRFYFMTNKLNEGNKYDIKLEYPIASNATATDTVNVINGINRSKLNIIPYANNNNTPKSTTLDADIFGTVLNTTHLVLPTAGTAGKDKVGLILGFDLPKELLVNGQWNSVMTGDLEAYIELSNSKADNVIKIRVKDLLGTKEIINESMPASNLVITEIISSNDGRFRLKIDGLPAGQIYNFSRISFTNTKPKEAYKQTDIEFPRVFSFIKYEIVSQNGQYYVQVFPYKDYPGNYFLSMGNSASNLMPAERKQSDGKNPIMFVIPDTQLAGGRFFQIHFNPYEDQSTGAITSKSIYSQIALFEPSNADLSVSIANKFKVINYKLTPIPSDPNKKAELDMKLSWNVAPISVIEKILNANDPNDITITYSLNKSFTPDFATSENFEDVVLTFKKEAGKIEMYLGADKITKTEFDEITGKDVFVCNIDYKTEVDYKDHINIADFVYPNIYFLNVAPIKVNNNNVTVTGSNSQTITLNDLTKLEVPAPQNLTISENNFINNEPIFNLKFDTPSSSLKDYLISIFTPPVASNLEISMNLYISQKEANIKALSELDYATRVASADELKYEDIYDDILDFNNPSIQSISGKNPRDVLRNDDIIRISNITLTTQEIANIISNGTFKGYEFLFKGLDKNQKYYITTDLYVKSTLPDALKASKTSNIATVLTKTDKEEIDENEKSPIAPKLQKQNISSDSVTIFWDKIKETQDPGSTDVVNIEYEIIRLTEKQMNPDILNSKIKFEDFFAKNMPETEKVGLRTNLTNLEMLKNGLFIPADKSLYNYDEATDIAKLYDNTLSPNQIYFYYVRTVRNINGMRKYSVWNDISVTTTPVTPPKNLAITDKIIEFTKETEVVIEFDAPIADIDKLGKEFWLQYSIREDDGDFSLPINMDVTQLKRYYKNLNEPGYLHFYYKISKLNPGSTYTIQVRIVDKKGDASNYSNEVKTRTEIDQDKLNENNETTNWVDYSKQEFEKLLNQSYWTMLDNSNFYEIIFREKMFESSLDALADGVYNLPSQGAPEMTYYFPSSALSKLNAKNKGMRVTYEDMEVLISANAIDENVNEAMKQIAQKLKSKSLVDYYIKLVVSFEETNEQIEGKQSIGSIAKVSFQIVGVNGKIEEFDNKMYAQLSKKVEEKITDNIFKDKLKTMVIANEPKENIVKEVTASMNNVKKDFFKNISKEFKSIAKDNINIEVVDAPIIIVLKNIEAGQAVHGYQAVSGIWQSMNVSAYSENKAIYTNMPGIYAFAGNKIVLVGIDGLDGRADITKIISKYDLADLFGKDAIKLTDAANKNVVIGSAARMLGAKKGEDNIAFMKALGVNVSSRSSNKPITLQDSIKILMAVYEGKTKTKIATIQIKNYNTVKNIVGLNDTNKKAIQVAIEAGIYKGNTKDANATITIKQLLDMLLALDF